MLFLTPMIKKVAENRPLNYMLDNILPFYTYHGDKTTLPEDWKVKDSINSFSKTLFFSNKHNYLYFLFFIFGIIFLKNQKKESTLIFLFTIIYIIIYTFIIYGYHWKYIVMFYPMFVIFSAYGAYQGIKFLESLLLIKKEIVYVIIIIFLLFSFISQKQLITMNRGDGYYLKKIDSEISSNKTISCCFLFTCIFELTYLKIIVKKLEIL
jgi:hypothetical protein